MKAETHATFAVGFAVAGAPLLHSFGYTEINYWLTIPLLSVFGKEMAKLVDADHARWKSVPDHTPFYFMVNKFLRLIGAKHRSLQTHSWDLCLLVLGASIGLAKWMSAVTFMKPLDAQVLSIMGVGMGLGWASHLFADMLTPGGVWLFHFRKKTPSNKVVLVPRKGNINFPGLRKLSFATGGTWESFVSALMFLIDLVIIAFAIFYGVVRV